MAIYLVTGAAGFIAARVCELLLEQGDQVVGIDNMNDAYDVRLKEWRLGRLEGRDCFEMHRIDICDRPALDEAWQRHGGRFEAVVNLAARAGVRQSVADPWVYFETNVTGTLNLLDLCRRDGVGKFVLASTSSLYGRHNPMPYREDADTNRALSPYAASKKGAEAIAYTYHYLFGIDTTVLRYFTVYGPAGRPDMSLFRFTQWIREGQPVTVFGDGSQSRDFTYVDDIARGTIAALKPLGYEIINLGSDKPAVLMDVIRMIERKAGREADFRHEEMHPADVPATWANIEKAKRMLGWEPRTSLEEGIGRLADWYVENRAWAREIDTA
ncbi:MAG: NAD-dependent epimerase/dehydratase family protein [Planctomycetota bacterium]